VSASGPPFVFDAHVDSLQRALDLGHDLGREGPGQLDLARGARGGLGAVVLVCWCEPVFLGAPGGAFERTRLLLRELHRLLARHHERARFASDGAALAAARAEGRVALCAGVEGGHSIEGSLDKLAWLFERGVRAMTLTWNNHLPWARSCRDGAGPEVPAGLSAFGREVVRAMDALGIVVDLSHVGERTFFDALEAGERPPIASHSGCRALHEHPRNLTDAQLRALAERGGVVGIPFCTAFLDAGARAAEARLREGAEYRALGGASETERALRAAEWIQRAAGPFPLDRLVDHVLHAAEVCGIEHVGLGSDFDGIERRPAGLEDASCYPALSARLAERGLSASDVRAVMGENLARVFAAVTGPGSRAHGARLEPWA
jgi:membrane dipeptidase